MKYIPAVKTCLKKYATFSGRASRSEFWYFFLFCTILSILTGILDNLLSLSSMPINGVAMLAVLIPTLAVYVRRLHDVDHSGWWLLISITVIGLLFPLLYWMCKRGTHGNNRFGADSL